MTQFTDDVTRLRDNLDKLAEKDRTFADSLLSQLDRGKGLSERQTPWITTLANRATKVETPVDTTDLGDVTRIVTILNFARTHLQYPSICMQEGKRDLRVSIAGEMSKVPGSITVTSIDRNPENGRRYWYGRITQTGVFQPNDKMETEDRKALADMLVKFAADPAKIASEYGRLHGVCCFCRIALSDPRSTIVGYGPICAEHFGLPWGDRKHSFECDDGVKSSKGRRV